MFYSIATRHCVMKINSMVVNSLVESLGWLDENNQFDQLHNMSDDVIYAIENIETQQFGFTVEFKSQMLGEFNKLETGETFAIVNTYLTQSTPETVFWQEFLELLHCNVDRDEAAAIANKTCRSAWEENNKKRHEEREQTTTNLH